jgi:hypothetical protein
MSWKPGTVELGSYDDLKEVCRSSDEQSSKRISTHERMQKVVTSLTRETSLVMRSDQEMREIQILHFVFRY